MLLIGYGNPGRVDDGLGPAFAQAFEELHLPDLEVESDYQLTVEDSATSARHQVVVFADASVDGSEPYFIRELEPGGHLGFSSHSVAPETLLDLAHSLFGAQTRGFVVGIRGYKFNEFAEELSAKARENLSAAVRELEPLFRAGSFATGGATCLKGQPSNAETVRRNDA